MRKAPSETGDSIRKRIAGDDPATLALLETRDVAAAIDRGDMRAAYEALRKLRRGGAGARDRAALDALLARRREFAARCGAPSLFTFNGIGTRLYGATDHDRESGTYVGTRFATVVYVPVWPLESYVVHPSGSDAWHFLSRVPLSTAHRTWRKAVLGLVVGLAAFLGWRSFHTAHYATVAFVNPLDVATTVTVGDTTVELAPGAVEHESVRRGPQHLVAKVASGPRSGVVIEELDVDVPTGDGWSCYAVLGAAPLHVEEVIYEREERRSAAPRLREPKDESLAGSAWTGRPRVDFAFEKAPDRLDLPKGASSMIRHRAFLAEGGWHAAVEALYANKDVKGGVALARRVALAELDESAIDWAGGLADEDGLAGIAAHAEKVLALAPDSVRAHRQRQDALCELGRRDDLVGEYRKRFEKQPTATNGYLYARLLRTAEALPLLGKLVGENPDHVWLRRSLAWNHQQGLRFSDAAAQYEKLASLDAAMGRESLRNRAQALVGAGRVAEAQRLVRAVIDKESKEENVLYGRIARVPGAAVDLPPGLALLPLLFERVTPGLQVEYLARIRDVEAFRRRKDEIEEVPYREASDLEVLSFREPGTAAEAARGVTEESLGMLDDLARLTLACELAYRRNEGLAKLVMEKRRPYGLDLPVATLREPAAFLGTVDAEESDLEAQAVLAYAASRRAQDPGERQRWLDFALARDVFRVVVPR